MKANELRDKSVADLKKEKESLLRELFNLRMQKVFSPQQLKTSEFGRVRKLIARVKTILHEKQRVTNE